MFGICNLSSIPVRKNGDDKSEMISQLLYGDLYEVIEKKEKWVLIKINFDDYKGWIDNKQFSEIESENHFNELKKNKAYSLDLINFVETNNNELIPIMLGSNIGVTNYIKHTFDGEFSNKIRNRKQLIETAKLYLNAPYLWGGKTPFGIDCSGLSQMVYKINGFSISLHSFIILSICCSVLTKANSFFSYSKFSNCDFKDKNILSRVSPVESDTRYTLYFSFIKLLINY